jgi:uncharacterized protein (UPF0210 family)
MELSETNKYIKDNFKNFIEGCHNDKFNKDDIEMLIEISFILNHIEIKSDSVIFEYGDEGIKLSNLHDMPFISEDSIISMIRNDEFFKSSYKSFLRDYKLNKIIK